MIPSLLFYPSANGHAFRIAKVHSFINCLLAGVVLTVLSSSAMSQTSNTLGSQDEVTPVLITGSRFPNAPDLAPIGAVVITATDIRNAGIDNVNEAIRKLAGIYGRQSSYGTQDYDLDMNGFGTNSANNLVVMVDGVRISENEMATSLFSSIPIESVARIEIMHSGSSVLYGDGATGGVIQIVTKQLGQTPLAGSLYTELGQFNDRSARATLVQGGDGYNAMLNLSEQKSDNYRVNNAVTQQNASGALTWYANALRYGLKVDIARQNSGLAGALTLAEFEQNPQQSSTPLDFGSTSTYRYTGFMDYSWGAWQVAAELSTRDKTVKADYVSFSSAVTYTGRQTQFSPRLHHLMNLEGMTNDVVIGMDLNNWNRQTDSSFSLAEATQKSRAGYVRDELKLGQLRLAAGVRREVFEKASVDPSAYSVDNYSLVQGVNAWELDGSYAFAPGAKLFANVGQSYRVANVDDNAFTPIPNTALLPQLSHDSEVGTTLGDATRQVTARLFRHNVTNEIYYDPTVATSSGFPGANTNLAPTRRQGLALEAQWRLAQQWRLMAQVQHVQAEFTEGVNQGKELALVPKNTMTAHINWIAGDGQSAYLGAQWIDTQRYGSDFDNSCSALIPAHASLDGRYAKTLGAWELALVGTNLTNKHYFTNAYLCKGGIYPEDGRQLKATLRYSF